MHTSSPLKSRLRPREYTLALLAGVFVFACFLFYSRDGAGLRPTATYSQSEPFKLPPDVDPSLPKASSRPLNGIDSTSSSSNNALSNTGLSSPNTAGLTLSPDSPRAIIMESAMIPNLVPLMLHFATVLGPSWGIILFTLEDGWVAPLSPAWHRHVADGHIEVRFLPAGTTLTNSNSVSRFLTGPWLWEQLVNAPRVLMFQTDSVLCARSEAAVEDYFEYDLVGAPILAQYGVGYNGGLSLRNPRLFLNVTKEVDFVTSGGQWEDQYFYSELKKRGAHMPAEEVAKTFAVETIYYETPLGYHQPQRWQPEHIAEIEDWCPEVKMLIGRRAS